MINLKFGDLLGITTGDKISDGLIKAVYLGEAKGSIGRWVSVITQYSEIIEVEEKDVILASSSNWDGIWEQKNG